MSKFDTNFFSYFEAFKNQLKLAPLNLGGVPGSGGGAGGPPGGFFGYLPQSRVSYDYSEVASFATPGSGMSLVDNLNHIRYRLDFLETISGAGGSTLTVQENDVTIASLITVLNFEGGTTVTNNGGGKVTISGGGGGVGSFASKAESQAATITDKAVNPFGLPIKVDTVNKGYWINHVADYTAANGNYQGNSGGGSVDLQVERYAATHVAAGWYGFLGGGDGNGLDVDSSDGVICGGYDNWLGATYGATIVGGYSSSITTNYATVLGGYGTVVQNEGQVSFGRQRAVAGDCQHNIIMSSVQTTNATQTGTPWLHLPTLGLWSVLARVIAYDTSNMSNAINIELRWTCGRKSGVLYTLGNINQTIIYRYNSSVDATLTMTGGSAGQDLRALVTGATSTTINWTVMFDLVQVA